jgi:glutamate synthase (NADPH/NADH) small chain
VSTQEFVDDGTGKVRALRLVEVQRGAAGFEAVEGSERELPADLVLLAMGFVGPEKSPLIEQLGVELDERGNIKRDAAFETTVPGVFVAGDAGRGQSLIVWAIAEGRSCAAAVDRRLTGVDRLPVPIAPTDRPLTV